MNIQHDQLGTWEPSVLDIIGDTAYDNFSQQEEILENAVASALWLRYRLVAGTAGEFVAMSNVIKGWHSRHFVSPLNRIAKVLINLVMLEWHFPSTQWSWASYNGQILAVS